MSIASRKIIAAVLGVSLWMIAMAAVGGCEQPQTENDSRQSIEVKASRAKLLGFAFEVATAIPLEPHRKDRARAQEHVVSACLDANELALAGKYAESIGNWRRGVVLGDVAFRLAKQGEAEKAELLLDKASRTAIHYKGWRKDRIKVRIARTKVLLGKLEQARQLAQGVEESETGKLAGVTAGASEATAFNERLEELQKLARNEHFDIKRNAVASALELLAHEYQDTTRREALVNVIREASGKMPWFLRVDFQTEIAAIAADHSDSSGARGFIGEASELIKEGRWRPEDEIRMTSRLAVLRHRAGDPSGAVSALVEMRKLFDRWRDEMKSSLRPDALRPLAEAYQKIGRSKRATKLYALVIDEGAVNPNARPRALDLSATCCSMAVNGVVPEPDQWKQMQEIRKGLKDPW